METKKTIKPKQRKDIHEDLIQEEVLIKDEQITVEEEVDDIMSTIDNLPIIGDLVRGARNRAERRKLRKMEKRGQKIAKQMQIDKEAARELFMQTLLEKIKAKNEEKVKIEDKE